MPSLSSAWSPVGVQAVGAASRVEEVARGHVDGDRHVAAGLEAAGEHGIDDDLEGLLVVAEPRPVTPLVADQGRFEAAFLRAPRRRRGTARRSSRGPGCSSPRRPG